MMQQYQYSPSNNWLALGEFIDNSISSFQNKNRNNPVNNLQIIITFDATDDNNLKIKIQDNAMGMDAKQLEDAMQPFDRSGKSDTDYNQYGVGMKLGIFWHGANVTIYSKKEREKEYKLELCTDGIHSAQEEIIVDSSKSNENEIKYNSGTTIIISKVYENKFPVFAKGKLKLIKDALGWRYSKLIEKGLTIRVDVITNDKNKNESEIIKPFVIKPFRRNQMFEDKKNSYQTNQQKRDVYAQRLNDIYEDIMAGKYDNNSIIREAYNKFNSNEDVILEKDIIVNNQSVKLKFGILDYNMPNKIKYSGVTIYHLDRAIMHGPNDNMLKASTFQFLDKAIGSGGGGESQQMRYLYGELDLTGIEKPDQNKSRFVWSTNGEQDIVFELKKIFNEMKPLLDVITKIVDTRTNKEMNEAEAKRAISISSTKLPVMKDFRISHNDSGEIAIEKTINFFGEEYDVQIYESWKENIKFIDVDHDEYNHKLIIKIEAENKFWKPLVAKEDDFKGELLFPLAMLIGMTDVFYCNNDKLKKHGLQGRSYSELMSLILEMYSNN